MHVDKCILKYVKHDLKILPEYFEGVISGKKDLNCGKVIGIMKLGIHSSYGSGNKMWVILVDIFCKVSAM